MAPPITYSEGQLADYQIAVLGDLATTLGWSGGSVQVIEAVNDALLEYGTTDISTIDTSTGILQLRALGRRAIWRAVAQATAGDYSITDNGQKLERQQVHEHAQKMVIQSDTECHLVGADPGYAVSVVAVNRPHDPYAVLEDSMRTLP